MLNEKVVALMQKQINRELASSYLYLDFANYFADRGLSGFANWYNVQAKEELDHGLLFIKYLQNNNVKVELSDIQMFEHKNASDLDVLKQAYAHEQYITASINEVYAAAHEANDYRTMQVLDWFVKEQGEEEKNAMDIVTEMELFGADLKNLYLMNQQLATRVYTAPSLVL